MRQSQKLINILLEIGFSHRRLAIFDEQQSHPHNFEQPRRHP